MKRLGIKIKKLLPCLGKPREEVEKNPIGPPNEVAGAPVAVTQSEVAEAPVAVTPNKVAEPAVAETPNNVKATWERVAAFVEPGIGLLIKALQSAAETVPVPGAKLVADAIAEGWKLHQEVNEADESLRKLVIRCKSFMKIIETKLREEQYDGVPQSLIKHLSPLAEDLQNVWSKCKSRVEAEPSWLSRAWEVSDVTAAIKEFDKDIEDAFKRFTLMSGIEQMSSLYRIDHNLLFEKFKDKWVDAAYNSAVTGAIEEGLSQPRSRDSCFDGTRRAVLDRIWDWAVNKEKPRLYIMEGIAGLGKTAIAQSVAERLAESRYLGASFFFSKFEDKRKDARRFFPTVAVQLAKFDPVFFETVVKVPPEAAGTAPAQQMKEFLFKLQPLPSKPVVVVFDALDECHDGHHILTLLAQGIDKLPALKVFVTCRPDIVDEKLRERNILRFVLHTLPKADVDMDIQTYLKGRLSADKVFENRPLSFLKQAGKTWVVSQDQLNLMVQASGALFIVAATAVRFVMDAEICNPWKQLDSLVSFYRQKTEVKDSPADKIDEMYKAILCTAVRKEIDRFQIVIGSLVLLWNPLSPSTLAILLGHEYSDVMGALARLQSIFIVTNDAPVYMYHPSFAELLLSQTRCQRLKLDHLHVDKNKGHSFLARRCLKIIEETHLSRKTTDALRYAATYWSQHLSEAVTTYEGLAEALQRFADHDLLFWIESLSRFKVLGTAVHSLRRAQEWLEDKNPRLRELLYDAGRLVFSFYDVINEDPDQVYSSVLPFIPKKTILLEQYARDLKGKVKVLTGTGDTWDACLRTMTLGSRVTSIAYSSDSKLIFCGREDGVVDVRDAFTGALQRHHGRRDTQEPSEPIIAVACSPTGTYMLSALQNGVLQKWSTSESSMSSTSFVLEVGAPVKAVNFSFLTPGSNGHSDIVLCLSSTGQFNVFSIDGSKLVPFNVPDVFRSASFISLSTCPDGTTLLYTMADLWTWNVHCRDEPKSLPLPQSPHGQLRAMILSSQGDIAALFEKDFYNPYFLLYRAASGWQHIRAPEDWGNRYFDVGPICKLSFSPDGRMVAAGHKPTTLIRDRDDYTIRIWDVESATLKTLVDSTVSSRLVFAPNCEQFASAEGDTIQIWELESALKSVQQQGQKGHDGLSRIYDIAISPDGRRILTASMDQTFILWDADKGSIEHVMRYEYWALAVAFSPDSSTFATGGIGGRVDLWDSHPLRLRHSSSSWEGLDVNVYRLTYNSDAQRPLLAVGGDKGHLQVWDVQSFEMIFEKNDVPYFCSSPLVFSPDNRCLAFGDNGRWVFIWDIELKRTKAKIQSSGSAALLAFSDDNQRLLICAGDGSDSGGEVVVFNVDGERGLGQTMVDLQTAEKFPIAAIEFGIGQTSTRVVHSSSLPALDITRFKQIASPVTYRYPRDGWIVDAESRRIWLPVEFRGKAVAWNHKLVFGNNGRIVIIDMPAMQLASD